MKLEDNATLMGILAGLVGLGAYVLVSKIVFDGAATPKELLPFAGFLVCTAAAGWAGVSFWKKNKP